MPRYYFDLINGDGLTPDDDGQVFETREEVRDEAVRILPDIARDEMPDGGDVSITVKVRDEAGRHIFEATLSLVSGWND
jgi:hypothetical protein